MKLLSSSFGASHLGSLLLAYDGKKSAFAAGPLPFESKEFVVKITEQNGREREFKVFAAKKDLHHLKQFLSGRQHDSPQETIQALDVVLRESASNDREVIGRSLFSPVFGKSVLGDGIEYWKGFYQSLGLSLNIDMSARAFYQSKLVSEFVGDFLNKDISKPLTDQEHIKEGLNKKYVGIPGMNSVCRALCNDPGIESKFGVMVGSLEWSENKDFWSLKDKDGHDLGQFNGVVASDKSTFSQRFTQVSGKPPFLPFTAPVA